jgi:transposase
MKIELKGQAKEKLGQSELVVITERVDDVALLIAQMIKMRLPEILDRHIPRHWKQRGLSWGWTAVIWLAYILTEGDHRKVSVEAYIKGMKQTLSQLTAQAIEPLDFSDDRLSHLLKHLSKPAYWRPIEQDLNARSIEVYDLAQDVIRCDATTVSGDHAVSDGGLFQFGHSKDDPTRPQIKIMMGSLDPLGMPLATDVLSGERADDGLYTAIIDRIQSGLDKKGLLFVGDCKMSALETRWHLASHQQLYLSPLPLTGSTAAAMVGWISQGMAKAQSGALEAIWRLNDRGQWALAAEAYEMERTCHAPQGEEEWTERVLMVRSPAHAAKQAAGLVSRLEHAAAKLAALTPPRGRGKRQITAEAALLEAIAGVLKAHRVEGLLDAQWEKQTECKTQYVGRGRGSASRDKRVIQKTRYQITGIVRREEAIAALQGQFGWKAFVTNAEPKRLSLKEAVLCYRNEYRVERLFNRLKSRVHIAPMFVTLNEQIEGLTHLLTLGVRVLTVMEFVVRQSLQRDQDKLGGLHPENKQKRTDKPTAERLLKAFSKVSLTLIQTTAGEVILRQVSPLSAVQEEILKRLGLSSALYRQLEI